MAPVVIIQSYEPLPELDGLDGLLPCDRKLARTLIEQRRAEEVDPWAEPWRYQPGTPAYDAMRAARSGGTSRQDIPPEKIAPAPAMQAGEASANETTERRGPGRPRKAATQ
jgi:hypothetical protein